MVSPMIDYCKFYHLERYLLEEVGPRFRSSGAIEPVDLFMIFIWKANRAKTKVRDSLKRRANGSFSDAVKTIATALFAAKDRKERLGILMRNWGLRLPMASAILTILYPDEFTVYDRRVCAMLPSFSYKDWSFSDECWSEYERYKTAVSESEPSRSLRDNDRFLWGKSFWQAAKRDAQ
jgi:hypothetical protein